VAKPVKKTGKSAKKVKVYRGGEKEATKHWRRKCQWTSSRENCREKKSLKVVPGKRIGIEEGRPPPVEGTAAIRKNKYRKGGTVTRSKGIEVFAAKTVTKKSWRRGV